MNIASRPFRKSARAPARYTAKLVYGLVGVAAMVGVHGLAVMAQERGPHGSTAEERAVKSRAAAESLAAEQAEILVPIPRLWPAKERLRRPPLTDINEIRFLTETDYPPFVYVDDGQELVGFNIDLARAICLTLELTCTVTASEWAQLLPSLDEGEGDAVIASVPITADNRKSYDLSDRYYLLPARFAAQSGDKGNPVAPETFAEKSIGVIRGSVYEAYLRDFFGQAQIVTFGDRAEMMSKFRAGATHYIFDDGIRLAFWLNGTQSGDCCKFFGGPYVEAHYFGYGAAIALRKGNAALRRAINYALHKLYRDGRFQEIFLRHFPVSFY